MPADIAPSPITAMTRLSPPVEVAGDRHAEPGRDRGRGMRRAEGVVFALRAPGEAGQAAGLAERADAVAPAGEDLVRIGLVADVPDQPVVRRVEDVVERHRQFDHAEPGAEMAAGDRDRRDRLLAELVGDLRAAAIRSSCRRSAGRRIGVEERRRRLRHRMGAARRNVETAGAARRPEWLIPA